MGRDAANSSVRLDPLRPASRRRLIAGVAIGVGAWLLALALMALVSSAWVVATGVAVAVLAFVVGCASCRCYGGAGCARSDGIPTAVEILLAWVALYPVVTAALWIAGGVLFRLRDEQHAVDEPVAAGPA